MMNKQPMMDAQLLIAKVQPTESSTTINSTRVSGNGNTTISTSTTTSTSVSVSPPHGYYGPGTGSLSSSGKTLSVYSSIEKLLAPASKEKELTEGREEQNNKGTLFHFTFLFT